MGAGPHYMTTRGTGSTPSLWGGRASPSLAPLGMTVVSDGIMQLVECWTDSGRSLQALTLVRALNRTSQVLLPPTMSQTM